MEPRADATEPFLIQIKNGSLKFSQNPFSVRTIFKGSVFYPIAKLLKSSCKTPFFSEHASPPPTHLKSFQKN
jgi:hypothetical protein